MMVERGGRPGRGNIRIKIVLFVCSSPTQQNREEIISWASRCLILSRMVSDIIQCGVQHYAVGCLTLSSVVSDILKFVSDITQPDIMQCVL